MSFLNGKNWDKVTSFTRGKKREISTEQSDQIRLNRNKDIRFRRKKGKMKRKRGKNKNRFRRLRPNGETKSSLIRIKTETERIMKKESHALVHHSRNIQWNRAQAKPVRPIKKKKWMQMLITLYNPSKSKKLPTFNQSPKFPQNNSSRLP